MFLSLILRMLLAFCLPDSIREDAFEVDASPSASAALFAVSF